MKIKLSKLRALIREAVSEEGSTVFGSYDELNRIVSAMDPDTVSEKDYVDNDTGEIYLEVGELARTSRLHPQRSVDARLKSIAKRNVEIESEQNEIDKAQLQFDAAISEFAQGGIDWVSDNVDEDPSGVVHDMAENFFYTYPQWKEWAATLLLTRDDIKTMVAEALYEEMT